MIYDICIIGAGVVGAAIARELSKYDLNVLWLEKEEDISQGASKANSGIVHGGYAAKYGTLKGELCIKGNSMYDDLNKELNFGFRKTGALVLGFNSEDEERIKDLYENGIKVGCNDIKILYNDEIRKVEPNVNGEAVVALYDKNVGVTSPYECTIALAENAVSNGVCLRLLSGVTNITKSEGHYVISTTNGKYKSNIVINAAGLFSDKIANMIGDDSFTINGRRGQYILLSKDQGKLINKVIFQVPTDKGKGILVTTTYHNNFMIGPNAEEVNDVTDVATTEETLEMVIETARKSIPNFDIRKAITTFSGIRAISSTGDFIIEESKASRGFINVAGIDSPGLTSAPAIALRVINILRNTLGDRGIDLKVNEKFDPFRRSIIVAKGEDFKGKVDAELPEENIICRCEKVTEAEIVDAIHRGIDVKTIDGIKRRTRAGMGPCQGSFCRCRVQSILARELKTKEENITQRGENVQIPNRVDINMVRRCKK